MMSTQLGTVQQEAYTCILEKGPSQSRLEAERNSQKVCKKVHGNEPGKRLSRQFDQSKQPKESETKRRHTNKYKSASGIIDLTLPTSPVEIYNNLGNLPNFFNLDKQFDKNDIHVNSPENRKVQHLVVVIFESDTVVDMSTDRNTPGSNMDRRESRTHSFLAMPPLKHNPPDEIINVGQNRAME